jgi:cytidine deaminase
MPVIVVKSEEEIRITTLGDLLPQSFTPADLG